MAIDYKKYVGPPHKWDIMGKHQFEVMRKAGLKPHHKFLDFGCGALRGGRFFIDYLDTGNYYGIEPNEEVLECGAIEVVGMTKIKEKQVHFSSNEDFDMTVFDAEFDYILAQSIWTHAAPTQIQEMMRTAKLSLSPKGSMLLTFLEGDEDYSGDQWVYPGCVRYKPDTIEKNIEAFGMNCEFLQVRHANGHRWVRISF